MGKNRILFSIQEERGKKQIKNRKTSAEYGKKGTTIVDNRRKKKKKIEKIGNKNYCCLKE